MIITKGKKKKMTQEQFEIAVKAITKATMKIVAESKTDEEKLNAMKVENMQIRALCDSVSKEK